MTIPTVACVIIAHESRRELVQRYVLPSVVAQDFDEIVCVGSWDEREHNHVERERYLQVTPLTNSTIDALVKRDVGTLNTRADVIVYLCDDHALAATFLTELRDVINEAWDVLVPNRRAELSSRAVSGRQLVFQRLNMGEAEGYCGGHAGVFRRHVVTTRPWASMPHHRNWDVFASLIQARNGARFLFHPRDEIAIIDLEESV